MEVKEDYDVLRLIEHNQVCYISSECIKGKTLPQWMKYHPTVRKEELFQIISDIAGQLSQIHRCRKKPCYRYVNPYSIVVSEDGKAFFLDVNTASNAGQLRIMKRRTVREHFLPPDEPYYQRESVGLDIYGLGRTLQYLFSETDMEPPLSRKEESRFLKIISRCLDINSKKSFQNVSEIQKLIPKYTRSKKEKQRQVGHDFRFVAVITGFCVIAGLTAGSGILSINGIQSMTETQKSEGQKKTQEDKALKEKKIQKEIKAGNMESDLSMELGLLHFLKLEDYEKSREYFEKAERVPLAEYMTVIAKSLSGDGKQVLPEQLRTALMGAETEIQKEDGKEIGEKADYYQCMIMGYAYLGGEEDLEQVLRLGEKCTQETEPKDMSKLLGYLAFASEGLGRFEEAADIYGQQMEYEEEKSAREELYKKTAHLLEQSGKSAQAQELLRKGIEEIDDSPELRILYVETLLKDTGIERELCIQSIKVQIQEAPELTNNEEFKKLLKQYGIRLEGE